MERRGGVSERIQRRIREYIESQRFSSRHREAFAKLQDAESLLWGEEVSEQSFTTIGHLCREAMQEFAASLWLNSGRSSQESDPAKTINRLREYVAAIKPLISGPHGSILQALLTAWSAVNELTQRQEQGGQKEGRPLGWNDGRLLVFQLMVVMFEIDQLAP